MPTSARGLGPGRGSSQGTARGVLPAYTTRTTRALVSTLAR